jgi:hypothetical protein
MSRTIWTLVALEARILLANRMAVAVIVFFLLAALHLRLNRDKFPAPAGEVCYVLYWEESDWMRALQASAARTRAEQGLAIEVLPADQLTGDDGVIRYPPGSCSIQIRPLEPGPDRQARYKIWHWHAGSDPGMLWPYAQWFWQTTRAHFRQSPEFIEETSPLAPELVVLGEQTRVRAVSTIAPDTLGVMLVALVLFFLACHLPLLSLSTAFEGRTIDSLASTPAGWTNVARAKRLFYGTLAVAVAAVVTLVTTPAQLASVLFWFAALASAVMFLGVAFTLGALTRSVASAGVSVIVYGVFASSLYATTLLFSADVRPYLSPEFAIWRLLEASSGSSDVAITRWNIVTLALWANLWHQVGAWAYRRRAKP